MKHPGIFREAHAQAETLVRTMIVATHNTARLAEFSAAGVTVVEWVSTIDSETTPECLGLDGLQWYMAEDPEDYENYIGVGHNVPFPGPIGPHIWNCRSTQIPVMPEEGVLALPLAMENPK